MQVFQREEENICKKQNREKLKKCLKIVNNMLRCVKLHKK